MNINTSFLKVSSKGFSLMEILVVIAIIGVVSALGMRGLSSIGTDAEFKKSVVVLESFLDEIKLKAFTDNKPYKIYINNNNDNINIKVYEPSGTSWLDPQLVRRCDCLIGSSGSMVGCNNIFLTSISGVTPIETKTIEKVNIESCSDGACANPSAVTVKICFLRDGTSPRDRYFKLSNSGYDGNYFSIKSAYRSGYVN
ncbi:type II secretion system GspH family protein [Pelagibacteraceae bacterium]|nr:type II secretion system GspH family protein [Pelagibacteraceae bacterium]